MSPLLHDALRRAETLFGRRVAVVDGDVRLTYADVAARCRRMAGALELSGVGSGDRVATLMANGHRYFECYFAIPGSGAVLVPLNNRLAVPELQYILEDAGVHTLIVDEANAEAGKQLAPFVKQVIASASEYEAWLDAAPERPLTPDVTETDLAGLFYTGGTTGAAKGVMLTHRNLVANAFHVVVAFRYAEDDTYLHVAPMFHLADGGSTYAITWVGGAHVFLPSFDVDRMLDVVTTERVTVVTMVPTMLTAIVNHPAAEAADFSTLRLVVHGAAPISTTLLRDSIERLGCSFVQGYGMTEGAPLVTALPKEEELVADRRLQSAGREVPGVEVTVRRRDGSMCAVDEVGEVVARGPNFMLGYWNKPDETAKALRDGWYWTGDLGYLDEEGYLFLVDRAKDMVISGGENVYSIEVEDAIATHPAVLESAVIGVPDDKWGERVHAVVVLREGMSADEDEIREHCRGLIAGFKCPRSVDFVAALPRSGAGKVLKRELRSRYWSDGSRQIN